MKNRSTPPLNAAQREALEARFAVRLSARLSEGAQAVPHDISERLRVAREQAIRAARESRVKVAAAAPVLAPVSLGVAGVGPSGTLTLGGWQEGAQSRQHGRRLDDGPTSWLWRLASAVPIITLVLGLWMIHTNYRQEQVQAAAEVDMALLADDLPPSAYADPGFEEFLRSGALEAVQASAGDASAP